MMFSLPALSGQEWFALVSIVQATAVLGFVLILCLAFSRKPTWRHSILIGALFLVGAVPIASEACRQTNTTWFNMAFIRTVVDEPADPPAELGHYLSMMATANLDSSQAAVSEPVSTQQSNTFHPTLQTILGGLGLIWIAGALLGLCRLCVGTYRLKRIICLAKPADRCTLKILEQVQEEFSLTPPINLGFSGQIDSPVAVGFQNHSIILPMGYDRRFQPADLKSILTHECAHIVRRDAYIVVLQQLAGIVLWFHPLIHMANRCLSRAREEICDNYVLRDSDPVSYSRLLLCVAETKSKQLPYPGMVNWFDRGWKLECRVSGILDDRRKTMTNMKWPSMLFILLGLCLSGSVLACSELRVPQEDDLADTAIQLEKDLRQLSENATSAHHNALALLEKLRTQREVDESIHEVEGSIRDLESKLKSTQAIQALEGTIRALESTQELDQSIRGVEGTIRALESTLKPRKAIQELDGSIQEVEGSLKDLESQLKRDQSIQNVEGTIRALESTLKRPKAIQELDGSIQEVEGTLRDLESKLKPPKAIQVQEGSIQKVEEALRVFDSLLSTPPGVPGPDGTIQGIEGSLRAPKSAIKPPTVIRALLGGTTQATEGTIRDFESKLKLNQSVRDVENTISELQTLIKAGKKLNDAQLLEDIEKQLESMLKEIR